MLVFFPSKRHQPVGKDSGKTNHIERFNNTWRQRVSRIARKTLLFCKKIENPIGTISIAPLEIGVATYSVNNA